MLRDKTILITGGGSGIGAALALRLAGNNNVIICGRNEDKLKSVSARNNNISYEVADISDHDSIDHLFNNLKAKGIVLNVLFNNAGVTELWEITRNKLSTHEIFGKVNTNFSGAVAVTQHFINQADHSVENIIVNNTSEIAILPVPVLLLYSASKAGLSAFTKSLRVQLKGTRFRVVELLTPGVDTDMPKQLGNREKMITPTAFAQAAVSNIERGKLEYAPGKNVPLLRFFQKFMPHTGLTLIDKLSRKQLALDR